jgi:periplasmic divalent cation tolerance protein
VGELGSSIQPGIARTTGAVEIAMAEYVQVLTTAGSEDEAERIGALLIERRLAACVQVSGPVASRYRWRGEVEEAREWRCVAKTEAARYAEVEAAIREAHSYEEPEIVAIPIVAGSAGYLDWIGESVRGDE